MWENIFSHSQSMLLSWRSSCDLTLKIWKKENFLKTHDNAIVPITINVDMPFIVVFNSFQPLIFVLDVENRARRLMNKLQCINCFKSFCDFFYHHWYKTTKVETWNCPSREPGTSWVWVQHCQSHYICLDKSSSLEQWWKRYLSKGKGICLVGLVNDISYDVYVCKGAMKKGTRGVFGFP